jgi:hypothetical protein
MKQKIYGRNTCEDSYSKIETIERKLKEKYN